MARQYTVTANCPLGFDTFEIDVIFEYTPGRAAVYHGPNMAPPEPAQVDFLSSCPKGGFVMPVEIQKLMDDWAEEWITNERYDKALDAVSDE